MNIFNFEVKRMMKSCLTWGLVCGVLIILFMSFYPSMRDSGIQELVETKLGAFPEGLMQAFGLDSMVDFTNIAQYMAYVIQYISMATAIYASILGVNSLLEEEIEGTIEFLYAQPVSRREIVTNKIYSRVFLLFLYLIIIGFIILLTSVIFKTESVQTSIVINHMLNIILGIAFVGFIFFSIGLFLSTILKPSINSTALSIGVFFITYVIGVLSKMREGLEPLRYLSPFDYAPPMDLVRNGWDTNYVISGFVIIIITITSAFIVYNKKSF